MTTAAFAHISVEASLSQAAKHMAVAVAALRDQGDNEYAAIIQSHLHGLERPHWIESNG